MTFSYVKAVTPALPPLSKFRSQADIDWLDIKIVTQVPTNFDTVQTHLQRILGTDKKNWVLPLDEGPGRAATIFVIRLHDPKTFASLNELFTQLEARFPFSAPPHIVAMEVAVDFYSRSGDYNELEAMTLRLMHETSNSGANPRQCRPVGRAALLETPSLFTHGEEVKPNGTYYSGTTDVDLVTWRIYLKITDNNQEPIPDARQHRARIEATMRGAVLEQYVTTLASLGEMRFQELATKFRCRLYVPSPLIEDLEPLPRLLDDRKRKQLDLASRAGQHMLDVSKRRKFSQHSRADVPLNTLIRGTLRGLSERFGTEKRGKVKAKTRISRGEGNSTLITNITTMGKFPPAPSSFSLQPSNL